MAGIQFFNGWDWDNHPQAEKVELYSPEVVMKAIDNGSVELGRAIAPELVSNLADVCIETLEGWLEVNAKPLELVDLVDVTILLARADEQLRAGTLSDHDAGQLINQIAVASQLIVKFGGVFHSAASVTNPREPINS